jgi:hypothetical protein
MREKEGKQANHYNLVVQTEESNETSPDTKTYRVITANPDNIA